jgi:hypothetical protein
MEANSLQSLLRCSSTIYAPGTGLPITWELTNVGRAPTHLFRDWFDATSFRELPRHPLSGFSLTILRSNGEVLPDFVQTGGAIGEAGPLQPVHLYRLNPGETYEIIFGRRIVIICPTPRAARFSEYRCIIQTELNRHHQIWIFGPAALTQM